MSNLRHLELTIEALQKIAPEIWAVAYPRRIVPPLGYANPRYFSINLAGTILCAQKSDLNMLPELTSQCVAYHLVKYKIPTFFVAYDFLCAIAATDPPEELNLVDVKFPLNAMLFVLPDIFLSQFSSVYSPFLAIIRGEKGIYPSVELIKEFNFLAKNYQIDNQTDRIMMYYPAYPENKDCIPVEYTGAYNLTSPISTIHAAQFVDTTKNNIGAYNLASPISTTNQEEIFQIFPKTENPKEDEKIFNQKMNLLAVKLLLSLEAASEYIEYGSLLRKQRIKHNSVKDELWNPNIIGRKYQIRQPGYHPFGTHASPRTHWRRGFWRHQKYGVALSKTKLIWIEPVLVNILQDIENQKT